MVKTKKRPAKFQERNGVDVILNNIADNPSCEHGPSILFETFNIKGGQKFYSCSACRDRKICPFYLEYENKNDEPSTSSTSKYTWQYHQDSYQSLKKIRLKNQLRNYDFCITCSQFTDKTEKEKHEKCSQVSDLTKTNIKSPSKILTPNSNSKYEAQYLFNDKSTEMLISMIQGLGTKKVLCIGSPRIHEYILNHKSKGLSSLLLDIDHRFCSFYSPNEFLLYNLFNNHFFGGSQAEDIFTNFITGDEQMMIVTDPPFGGRMELIANTLELIEKKWRKCNRIFNKTILPLMFVFPYFMEGTISQSLPKLKMLEYKVDYDNHPLYTTGPKGMKNGSPVRVFVNVAPKLFPLPEEEGYRFCEPCLRWVYEGNTHCMECKGCMSKDGSTYKHCASCRRCVKPSWIHCEKCIQCFPKDHRCIDIKSYRLGMCHICKKKDHKRRDCPKRKALETNGPVKKKFKPTLPSNIDEETTRNLAILNRVKRMTTNRR